MDSRLPNPNVLHLIILMFSARAPFLFTGMESDIRGTCMSPVVFHSSDKDKQGIRIEKVTMQCWVAGAGAGKLAAEVWGISFRQTYS